MKSFNKTAIVILMGVLVTACSDFDDVETPLDNFKVNLATVGNPDEKNVFFLNLDDSTMLWTAASAFHNYKPKDGQRVLANYTILDDKRPTGLYDYDVRLNDVYEVLTKPIFNITPATQDSIGNDPIQVTEIWIGSKYLNVEFVYYAFNKAHFINLVKDDSKTYDDGKIHLEFRHNAMGDFEQDRRYGLASFDISSLMSTTTNTVPLVIHVNKPNQVEDELHNLTFNYNIPVPVEASVHHFTPERIKEYQSTLIE